MSEDVTAAVEAVLENWSGHTPGCANRENPARPCVCRQAVVEEIRAALHDPTGALTRVRAEAAAGALREAITAIEREDWWATDTEYELGEKDGKRRVMDMLRDRAERATDHG